MTRNRDEVQAINNAAKAEGWHLIDPGRGFGDLRLRIFGHTHRWYKAAMLSYYFGYNFRMCAGCERLEVREK